MNDKVYVVYILTNKQHGTLYIGVTGNFARRMKEHRAGVIDGFTKKYDLKKLVYFEKFADPITAIAREKELKHFLRQWKIDLIEKQNPKWEDLLVTVFGMNEIKI